MNPAQLLAHFDRISDAPDAIPRFRRFILDLAVRGKLVEQDPRDEPASELLKRIKPEGARGEEKAKALLPELGDGDALFELPYGWCWVRFGEIYSLEYGDNLPAEKRSNTGEYPVYGSNGVVGTHSVCFVREPCIVVGRKGSAGALNLSVTEGCCVTDVAYYCIPPRELDLTFSFKLFHTLGLDTLGKGIKPGLSRNEVYVLPVAVPPLAEQHRIVAKVDELMALCDRLEAAQAERDSRRDRLVGSTLNRLNNGADPDAFRNHARFYFNHLPRLTTKPEHIQQLRQTILNLAVRGKLVPQDPNDEPASVLLQRISQEKEHLIEAREIQRPKALPVIDPEVMPFKLPKGWQWARVWEVAKVITSGSRDWAKYYSNAGPIFVTMGNLSRGDYKLRMDPLRYVSPPADGEGSRTRLEENDLLISITGDVGNLGLIPADFGEAYINQHTCLLRFMPDCQSRYFPELMRSPWAKYQFDAPQRGIKNSFRLSDVGEMLIPVPPLAEQQRIVAKVDELMALCDKLDAQLTTTHTDSRRLLEAVLHEALAPVGS